MLCAAYLQVVMCQVPSETVYIYQTGLPGATQLLSRISCTRCSIPSHIVTGPQIVP